MEHLETWRLKVIKACQVITVWFLRQGITCSQADYNSCSHHCSFFLFFIKASNTRFSYFVCSLYLALFVCFIHSPRTSPLRCHRLFLTFLQPFPQIAISLPYGLSSSVYYHLTKHTFCLPFNVFVAWLLSANKSPRRGSCAVYVSLALLPIMGGTTQHEIGCVIKTQEIKVMVTFQGHRFLLKTNKF